MIAGLLWYDNNPDRSLDDKVRAAAARFAEKFGCQPDHAYVNRSAVENERTIDGITVTGANDILRNHIWIGRETESR